MLMSSEEALSSRKNVSDNNGGAKRVDYVFVVGVKEESIVNIS